MSAVVHRNHRLLRAPGQERRRTSPITRLLNDEIRVLGVVVQNNRSIRSSDGEAEHDWSTLLPEHDTEGEILARRKRVRLASLVSRVAAASGHGVGVGASVAPVGVSAKVQEDHVVCVGS